jgi:hypothetical protein
MLISSRRVIVTLKIESSSDTGDCGERAAFLELISSGFRAEADLQGTPADRY